MLKKDEDYKFNIKVDAGKDSIVQKMKELSLILTNFYVGNIKITINTNVGKKAVKVNIEEHGL